MNFEKKEDTPQYNQWTYGIARCSTNKQDVQYEITELVKKGVPKQNIFIEYITGKADLSPIIYH